MKILKHAIKKYLKKYGIGIIRYATLERLHQDSRDLQQAGNSQREINLLQSLNNASAQDLLYFFKYSRSQLRQDLFVLSHLAFKKNGYFVEFGATNGYDLSNTYLMEKELYWTGILVEPATVWHRDLKRNRSCNIETNCVWKDSNSTVAFNQVETAELSTIDTYSEFDLHKDARKVVKTYEIKTISLGDLFSKYNAPKHIDYLSIDTEGSEYDILENFDFSEYTFSVITCEHNYTPMRGKIYSLLTQHGYRRVYEDFSLFDDWYVRR